MDERVSFTEETGNRNVFFSAVKGLESEPEGGAALRDLFSPAARRDCERALLRGAAEFSTTLSVSPHKNHQLLSTIGCQLAQESGIPFLAEDFKKKPAISGLRNCPGSTVLYRQNYCGCSFSKWFAK